MQAPPFREARPSFYLVRILDKNLKAFPIYPLRRSGNGTYTTQFNDMSVMVG